jgi:LysM repeat protein
MCDTPLDRLPVQGMLRGVSLPGVVAVAVLAGLIGAGWNWWRTGPPPPAVVATTPNGTPRASTATPTAYLLIEPTATPTPETPTPAASPTTPAPSATPIIHVIKSGETLLEIAAHYGASLDSIMKANGLDEDAARRLRVGQEIVIPETNAVGGPLPEPTVRPRRVIHRVQAGDTLISIAAQYDADMRDIMAANPDINPNLIYVGQEIIVPLAAPTATPTSTGTATPTGTPTPPYHTPDLLYPAQDQVFEGPDAVVLLSWTAIDVLSTGLTYLVEIQVPGWSAPLQGTTQGTSWRLAPEMWPTSSDRTFGWRVTVVRQLPDGSLEPVSAPSEVRRFEWR